MVPGNSANELKAWIEPVYLAYAGLGAELHPETGLGGKLLYAGELDVEGCRLVRAANIAGAGSLSATADAEQGRTAIREGVVDFLVTSLDEALRILKNEIRKRNGVAVGLALAPVVVTTQMRERGVLPDLLRNLPAEEISEFVRQGARVVEPGRMPEGCEFCVWANPTAEFTERALALIAESDVAARRWLRMSPRYLGPPARRARSVPCNAALAAELAGF